MIADDVIDPQDIARQHWAGALWVAGTFKLLAFLGLASAVAFLVWALVGDSSTIEDLSAVGAAVGGAFAALFLLAIAYVIEVLVGIWEQILGVRLLGEGNEPE